LDTLPPALIRFFEQYHAVSGEALAAIADISEPFWVKKNTEIQPIGRTCKTIYFIIEGIARIHYYKNGTDITEYFAFGPDIVVRAESLFRNQPSQKAIEIIENAQLVATDAAQLFQLYDRQPGVERLFRKIFEDCYVDTINRLESIQFHTAKERYIALLNEQPKLLQRVSLKHIASYLGITQVTLSRIRASAR
jgi:CRP-like cAMP-binding protein